MNNRVQDFDFSLPKTLIAQEPARPRDSARLWDSSGSIPMTYNNESADKTTGAYIKHHPWVTGAGN
ncbi:MAG: S-adenosylmethionine:tRNA ribosyltransferase-isomerase, partial [Acetobacter sp.]|nr:S-adenosylmethionine:tRNA ribosyltransferase-isomerase [Acetobacter sp.]